MKIDIVDRARKLYNDGFIIRDAAKHAGCSITALKEALDLKNRKCLKCGNKFAPEGRFFFTCPSCRKQNGGYGKLNFSIHLTGGSKKAHE